MVVKTLRFVNGSIFTSYKMPEFLKKPHFSRAEKRRQDQGTSCLHFDSTDLDFAQMEQVSTPIICPRAKIIWEFLINIVFNGRREIRKSWQLSQAASSLPSHSASVVIRVSLLGRRCEHHRSGRPGRTFLSHDDYSGPGRPSVYLASTKMSPP